MAQLWDPAETQDGMFVGFHELSIDDKNRISIPSSIRAQVDSERDGSRFFVAPGERERTLELFCENFFPAHVQQLRQSLGRSDDAKDFKAFFLSMSSLLETDKQGRVLLPQQHLQYAGIGKHVLLTGNGDRLIMWNREDANEFIKKGWGKYREMRRSAERENETLHPGGAGRQDEGQAF